MKELYDKLGETSQRIGNIANYYGRLSVSSDDDKFYWSIGNYDETYWAEIPEELYMALLKYHEEYKHTFEER